MLSDAQGHCTALQAGSAEGASLVHLHRPSKYFDGPKFEVGRGCRVPEERSTFQSSFLGLSGEQSVTHSRSHSGKEAKGGPVPS